MDNLDNTAKDNAYTLMLVFTAVLLFSELSFAQDTPAHTRYIPAYSYHLKPPFIIDQPTESGLYYDFVEQLSDSKYQYYLVYMPRKRIDRLLANGNFDGIVVGVSPHWFKDTNETKFDWTEPFIADRDDIISHGRFPFEYSAENIIGKTMAGVRGFYYANVNQAIRDNTLSRFDTESETQVIEMVLRHRVDFGIVSSSTFNYLRESDQELNTLHISDIPHESFTRRVLVPKGNPDILAHLEMRIQKVVKSKDWTFALGEYGLESLAETHMAAH